MTRLIEKKDKDKRFIQNWGSLFLLNTDVKILSKVMAQRLKKTLPFLISANQSVGLLTIDNLDGLFIGEGGRLISDLLEISDKLKLDGLLVITDTQKAFHSVNHSFLISTLERYGFGNKFVKWIKTFTQKSRILHNKWRQYN